jgi:hypothetical protein
METVETFDIHGKPGVDVEYDIAFRQRSEMPMDDIRLPGP